MDSRSLQAFVYLSATFVAALIAANVVSGKIVSLGGLFVPAGVLAYSITFAMTDTLCEVWGRGRTQLVVRTGFAVQLLVWLLIAAAIGLPPAPFGVTQAAFAEVLGSSNVVIVASLTAYLVSQTFDVWVFGRLKAALGGRHLWLRNNVSTGLSQTIDTLVFIGLFTTGMNWLHGAGIDPLPLIAGQLVVKWIIALVDTPVVYALVYLVRRLVPAPEPTGAAA